ncbi:hypothetical protein, partial [Salinimicrobium oceani]|uniref:hypothetical protein n=1 Tax=Salinimicrobium oceani TaxID=2722702 RepID=UPI001ADDC9A3
KKPFLKPEWICKNCGETLKISNKRKVLLAFVGIAPTVLFPYLADVLNIYLSPFLIYFLAAILLLMWALVITGMNKFSPAFYSKSRFSENNGE